MKMFFPQAQNMSQNNAGIVFSCYTPGNEKRD
jgi:hypothetical protein